MQFYVNKACIQLHHDRDVSEGSLSTVIDWALWFLTQLARLKTHTPGGVQNAREVCIYNRSVNNLSFQHTFAKEHD